MKQPFRHHTTGFTLVEVLVAMMVMAIIAVMAWRGVDGIVRARDSAQLKLEQILRVNTVMAQFEYDISARQKVFNLDQLDQLPAFDGASWSLVRRSPNGLQLVVWSLRGGSWLRWASPEFVNAKDMENAWSASRQFLGNETGQLRTLTGVSDWQMHCSYGSNWGNCQSAPGLGPLQAVRTKLSFGPGSGLTGTVTREFFLGTK